ncbi:MAG: hypothetical protein WCT05_00610 [Lentisphaeria bacterium]
MKIMLTTLALSLLLLGCGTTRSLQCPFEPEQMQQSNQLTQLIGEWELYTVNDEKQPEKFLGSLFFARSGNTISEHWLTVQMVHEENGKKIMHPPCRGRGADIDGETFLALSMDLPKLAQMASVSDPGNLAIPVYLLLRLIPAGKGSFVVEGITYAKYQNSKWEKLDPSLQITEDGLVLNDAASQLQLLRKKKFAAQGVMYLQTVAETKN